MTALSRRKGASAEREVAAIIRDLTGWDVRRRVRQHDGDSDLEGVPGWSLEVKRHAKAPRASVRGWWQQAVRQAAPSDSLPCLVYRADRDVWRAVWPVGALTGEAWRDYEATAESSIHAWLGVVREGLPEAAPAPVSLVGATALQEYIAREARRQASTAAGAPLPQDGAAALEEYIARMEG